jgi:hypothetical protein
MSKITRVRRDIDWQGLSLWVKSHHSQPLSIGDAEVALWQILGFIVGTLPRVFRHQKLGYVDAYVMHRFLIA